MAEPTARLTAPGAPAADVDEARKRLAIDVALGIVTLGAWLLYWLWRRNEDARARTGGMGNAWLLGIGGAVAVLPRVLLGAAYPGLAAAVSGVGIVVFAAAIYVLAGNLEAACLAARAAPPAAPALAGGVFAAAGLLMEAGNLVASLWLRLPALALLASTLVVLWNLHAASVRAGLTS